MPCVFWECPSHTICQQDSWVIVPTALLGFPSCVGISDGMLISVPNFPHPVLLLYQWQQTFLRHAANLSTPTQLFYCRVSHLHGPRHVSKPVSHMPDPLNSLRFYSIPAAWQTPMMPGPMRSSSLDWHSWLSCLFLSVSQVPAKNMNLPVWRQMETSLCWSTV